ncbi:pathogenesis-related thaumatin-like protein 3.5 [Vigna umbellata]|uniref:pathogenesis-related thaumatin-like protein 3.5 n=1 Tax=Vigna umbellata TaxID=87088 RepID=UPI001F5FE954|nr:pathogenesis-related thaumatin-like protein 3.5 [Vigna umbellata]
MEQLKLSLQFLLTLHLLASGAVSTTTFTVVNKCDYSVWPGILSNAGIAPLPTTGFLLQTGESKTVTAPTSWGGRLWGRTLCTQDSAGKFFCLTGDCSSGTIECAGKGALPPATLAEFTLDGDGGLDFFDVSLVDGYNVPMLVAPRGGSGDNCTSTGCVGDLNGACPSELRVTSVDGKQSVACRSACEAFGSPQYCCKGAYGSPNTCKPTAYSRIFKNACPRAYSYAYDDRTSTFTCGHSADYTITFCPSPKDNPSQKSWQGQNPKSDSSSSCSSSSESPPVNNGTMVYMDESEFPWSVGTRVTVKESQAIAGFVSITIALWLLCNL